MKRLLSLFFLLLSANAFAVDHIREKTLLTVSVKELKETKELLKTALDNSDRSAKYRLKYAKLMLDIDLWIIEIERYKNSPSRSPDLATKPVKNPHSLRIK